MSVLVARGRVVRALAGLSLLLTVCPLLSGCSSSSGNLLGLYGGIHRLTPEARSLRSAYPEPLPRELDKRVSGLYVVEPGDVQLVQPANLDSPVRLPGDQTVLPDGKVYYVLGEVNAPGAFPLQGRETVLDAILAAGGLNDKASRKFITLTRPTRPDGCRVVLPICYNEIVQLGDTSTNYEIASGDRIYVPTRGHDDCGRRQVCPPCGRPQSPCPPPEGCPTDPSIDTNSAPVSAGPVIPLAPPAPSTSAAKIGPEPEVRRGGGRFVFFPLPPRE
jgi:hypothetical protein